MNTNNMHMISKLDDFLNAGEISEISKNNTTISEIINDKNIPLTNIMLKYEDIINGCGILIELTDAELNNYKYNPKKLSFDLYGTTELYYILLMLNDMYSVTQFNKKKIYIFDKTKNGILDRIYQQIRDIKNKREY